MNKFFFSLSFFVFITAILAAPLDKRLYQPTSPVFSLIAHHNGSVFTDNLVKVDSAGLSLLSDNKAFYGRIMASNGYILNLPQDSSNQLVAATTAVYVDKHNQLVTTDSPVNASSSFGIKHSLLTYKESNQFIACPSFSFMEDYGIFFKGNATTFVCPGNSSGYDIQLMVQVDATVNYDQESNKNSLTKRFLKFLTSA